MKGTLATTLIGIICWICQPFHLFAQTEDSPLWRVELTWIASNSVFGEYDIPTAQLPRLEVIPTRPTFQIGTSYRLTPTLRLGLQYTDHKYRQQLTFTDPALIGEERMNPAATASFQYRYTDQSLWAKHQSLGLFVNKQLWTSTYLTIDARLSYEQLRLTLDTWNRPIYDGLSLNDQYGWDRVWMPGVGAGLSAQIRILRAVRLRISAMGIQGIKWLRVDSPAPFRYAHLGLGLETDVPESTQGLRHNTIFVGIGLPSSISYERLLWAGDQLRHSLRAFAFYASIGYDRIYRGGAYNLKWGNKHHFLLAEVQGMGNLELTWGGVLGYEYRSSRGWVVRIDGGVVERPNYRVRWRNTILQSQLMLGYAF
ncbi:MAG: hypothetical protein AAF399_29935 [Bacteroidota bacterium]